MVGTIYIICHDDTESRFQHDDNGQGNSRRTQRRTGDKTKRHL